MNDKIFIALCKFDDKQNVTNYVILANSDDRSIRGWHTLREAKAHFEDSYNTAHSRSYEGSMSACVNFMFFNYSIIETDLEEIKGKIAAEDPGTLRISHISGRITGITTRPEAKDFWDRGVKPSLITEDFNRVKADSHGSSYA
jgi:hypothetical protein